MKIIVSFALFLVASMLYADSANIWQYDSQNKFLTNSVSNWKIPVSSWNMSTGVLTLDRDTGTPKRLQGSGDLDLRNLYVQSESLAPVKVTRLILTNVSGNRTPFYSCKQLTSFYADNVDGLYNLAFDQCSALTNVILSYHPNFNKKIPAYAFRECTSLTCDISQIVPEYITEIQDYAFSTTPVTGTLRLNNVSKILQRAFLKSNLSAIELGGPLTRIADYAFDQSHLLTQASFRCRDPFTVNGGAFRYSPFKTITFEGGSLTSANLDNILAKVATVADTAVKGKDCTIYVSKLIDGGAWRALAAPLSGDEGKYAPKGTIGVYRASSRKAWLVHRLSSFDPNHFLMQVR